MKIVHVTPFYAPVIGGVEEVVKRIAEFTASRGYKTYVVTYNRLRRGGVGAMPREEVINGVRVIRLRPDVIWSHGSLSTELLRIIRSLRPDVVHVHVWRHPHVFQIAALRRKLRFRAVLHGHAPFHAPGQLGVVTSSYHKLVDVLGGRLVRLFDTYVALTPDEAMRVVKLGLGRERVVVIPNGVDEDSCDTSSALREEGLVLYLGRVSAQKNLDLLVRAAALAAKSFKLAIAGPDEGIVNRLLEYARRRGVELRYLGPVSDEVKHLLYSKSTVYALPSIYEPFGMTLLEAAIHGTPSVITGEGGQLYAAPPGRASVWARPDPRSYAEAIIMLLTDGALWRRLSHGAREWALLHTWDKILPRYERLYCKLTSA